MSRKICIALAAIALALAAAAMDNSAPAGTAVEYGLITCC